VIFIIFIIVGENPRISVAARNAAMLILGWEVRLSL